MICKRCKLTIPYNSISEDKIHCRHCLSSIRALKRMNDIANRLGL